MIYYRRLVYYVYVVVKKPFRVRDNNYSINMRLKVPVPCVYRRCVVCTFPLWYGIIGKVQTQQ